MQRATFFTLIELLVVVAIIAILAGLLMPGIAMVRNRAKQTQCVSQFRNMGVAVLSYQVDFPQRYPPWLSNLYPEYIANTKIYACPSDPKKADWARSSNRHPNSANYDDLKMTFDAPGGVGKVGWAVPNDDVPHVSYIYEFCAGRWPSAWSSDASDPRVPGDTGVKVPEGVVDWTFQDMKLLVLQERPYLASRLPMARCYWHAPYEKLEPVLNLSPVGSVYFSKADWQQGTWNP